MQNKKPGRHRWVVRLAWLPVLLLTLCMIPRPGVADDQREDVRNLPSDAAEALDAMWGDDSFVDPVSEQGQRARGAYFNGPTMRRLGAKGILQSVQSANLNAVVLDLKDGQGRIMWDTQIPEVRGQRRRFVKDFGALVQTLRRNGIYVIGRMVCFSDPELPVKHPELAVMDGRRKHEGEIWANNGKRNPWLDPYNTRNHDLIVAMAKEVAALGIDELQFDYFRFPVDEATPFAVFPAHRDVPRREVLLGLLRRVDEALRIPLGVDVFGLTAFHVGDRTGLGQSLEDWARYLEVFSPMLYVNGMGEWMRDEQGQRAYRLVLAGVSNMRKRLGHGPVIRPFLQAFENGADYYNPEFIAEQIHGARFGGADGFLFWHPASDYTMVRRGLLGPARASIPFPMDDRMKWRRQTWRDRMLLRATAEPVPGDPLL